MSFNVSQTRVEKRPDEIEMRLAIRAGGYGSTAVSNTDADLEST